MLCRLYLVKSKVLRRLSGLRWAVGLDWLELPVWEGQGGEYLADCTVAPPADPERFGRRLIWGLDVMRIILRARRGFGK